MKPTNEELRVAIEQVLKSGWPRCLEDGENRPNNLDFNSAAILRAHLETFDEERAVIEAAHLKRNTVIRDSCNFEGTWIAVPEEDFDKLADAYRALVAKRDGK